MTFALGAPLGACVDPPFPNGGSVRGGGGGFGGSSSSDGGISNSDGGDGGAGDAGVLPGVLFSRVASGTGDGAAVAVAVDGSGAAVVLGSFRGTLDFGGAAPTAGSNGSAFLARYDATGKLGWLKTFPASAADALSLTALAVTTTGDVVIAGGCAGTVDLGGGALAGGADSDVCVARYDSAGKHRLSRRLGDNAAQSARAVALDDAGAIFLGGALAGTMTIDGTTLRSAGQKDAFLVKLDSTGKLVFGRSAGDGSDQEVQALRPDGEGGVVAAGSFVGSITQIGRASCRERVSSPV
mgnify:CR=1 FL=1